MAGQSHIFTVDTSGLNRELTRLWRASNESAADLVNRKALWIVRKALWNTVKTDPERIASELQAGKATQLRKLKGKGWSKAKKNAKWFFGAGKHVAPFLALIVQSRVANSQKNAGPNPWPSHRIIPHSPWKGVRRAVGAVKMLEAMRKVFSARRSSVAYIASGWLEALYTFMRRAPSGSGPLRVGSQKGVRRYGRPKGGADAATPSSRPIAWFWNTAWSKDDGGAALLKYARPALEAAIASEKADTARKADEREMRDALRRHGVLGIRIT